MTSPKTYALLPAYDEEGMCIGSAIMEYAGYVIPLSAANPDDALSFQDHLAKAFTVDASLGTVQ